MKKFYFLKLSVLTSVISILLVSSSFAQEWTNYTTDDGLAGDNVFSIVIDDNNDVWFTGFVGVSKFDGTDWTTYTETAGLCGHYFWTTVKDNDGNIWFPNTDSEEASMYDGNTFTTYTMPGVYEECSYVDSDGNVWFGSFGGNGAVKFDGTDWTTYTSTLIPDGVVLSITEDSYGNMYFATNSGLVKYDGVIYSDFVLPIPDERVWELFTDSQGNLWISANSAIHKYDGNDFTTYSLADGIHNGCQDIAENSLGDIYFVGEAVDIFDGTSWSSYTSTSGLPGNTIFSIGIDENDGLYLGFWNSGVYYCDLPESINETQNNVSVYPNPTSDFLNINLENVSNNVDIKIYNLAGQLIYSSQYNQTNSIQLDISNNVSGIYFVKIQTDEYTESFKIIKE